MLAIRKNDLVEKLFKTLFILTVPGYALVAVLGEYIGVDSRVITIPFRALVLGVSILIIILNLKTKIIFNKYFGYVFFVFAVIYSFRLIVDTIYLDLNLKRETFEYCFYWFGITLLPSLVFIWSGQHFSSLSGERFAKIVFWIFMIANLLLILYSIHNLIGGFTRHARAELAGLGPIALGHNGVSLGILSAYIYVNIPGKKIGRFIYLIGICVGVILILLSGTRSALLGFFLLLLFLLRKNLKSNIKVIIAFLLLIPFLLYWVVESGAFEEQVNRFLLLGEIGSDSSSMGRITFYKEAINLFLENPIFGSHIEILKYKIYPHNIILEAFMSIGVLGGIGFLYLIMITVKRGLKLVSKFNMPDWILLFFFQFLMYGMTSGTIYSNNKFWHMLIMLNAFYYICAYKRKRELI